MLRFLYENPIYEFDRNTGVDDTNYDCWHDHRPIRHLLVMFLQGAKCWRLGVLAQVNESDYGRDQEKDERQNRKCSKSLGKVARLTYLRDEGWEENLREPQECDVEHGVETLNPGCPSGPLNIQHNTKTGYV